MTFCKNIFKNGKSETTSKEFTEIWINLINQIECSKAMLSNIR